jgi:hypothetical protein
MTLKEHLEQEHGVDIDRIDISLEEAHAIDHDEWLADQHTHAMKVKVRDDSESGFAGQTGQVIGRTAQQDLKVQLDSDPDGPHYIYKADELTIVEDNPAWTRIWSDPDVKLTQLREV